LATPVASAPEVLAQAPVPAIGSNAAPAAVSPLAGVMVCAAGLWMRISPGERSRQSAAR
jgi:hypothetical protein